MGDRVASVDIGRRAESMAAVYSLLVLGMLFVGVNFVVMRITLAYLPPITAAEARFAGSALLLFVVLFLIPRHRTPVRLADIPIIAAMGASGFAVCTTLLNYGLLYSSAGESAIIVGTSPVITALIASLWLKERVTVVKLVGLALAFGGVATIVLAREGLAISADHLLADLASLGSAISISLFAVTSKVAMRRFSPLAAVTYSITAGAIMLIPAVSLADGWQPLLAAPINIWQAIAYTVFCATVYSNVVWCSAIKRIGATSTAVFNNGITVAAVFSGAIMLQEPITVFHLIGLVLVIAGILVTTRTIAARAPRTPAVLANGR